MLKMQVGAVVALLAGIGCATPYQEMGFRGGVEHRRLGGNTWIIKAKGNGYTSRSTLIEYTYRRAAEVCPYGFDPIDADRSTRHSIVSFDGGKTEQDVAKSEAVLVVACYAPPQRSAPGMTLDPGPTLDPYNR